MKEQKVRADKHLSIRMDGELHDKFQYAADFEGRSMSRQVLYLIQQYVREFEREYGAISEGDLRRRERRR